MFVPGSFRFPLVHYLGVTEGATMQYKIVHLSWCNEWAVMARSNSTGWTYIQKNISRADAEKLLREVV